MSDKSSVQPTISTYYAGLHWVLCSNSVDKLVAIHADEKLAWKGSNDGTTQIDIDAPELFGGNIREGGIVGKLDLLRGLPSQGINTYLSSVLGASIPYFRGVTSIVANRPLLGTNYYLKPWAFTATRIHNRKNGIAQWQDTLAEVPAVFFNAVTITRTGTTATVTTDIDHKLATGNSVIISGATDALYNKTTTITVTSAKVFTYTLASTPTANAAGTLRCEVVASGLMNGVHIVREILTDPTFGFGFPDEDIDEDDFVAAATACYNERLAFAFLVENVGELDQFLTKVLEHIQATVYQDRKTGKYHINLIREVTELEGLLTLNTVNTTSVEDFHKKSIGEIISSVTVKFLDNATNKTNSVTFTDISLYSRQAAPNSKTIEYSGIANLDVAQKLCVRDLRQLSTAVYSCNIVCNRDAENLNLGDVFILDWPDYMEDTPLVMRVMGINLGSSIKGSITIQAMQDVFSAPDIVYDNPPATNWVPPTNAPIPIQYRVIQEVPYYIVATTQGDAFAQALPLDKSYIIMSAVAPTGDAYAAGIWTNAGGAYTKKSSLNFCFTATLTGNLDRIATVVTLSNVQDIELLTEDHFIQVGTEYMGVVSISGSTLEVIRGVLDTVPVTHTAGDRVFGVHDFYGSDKVAYLTAEDVNVKLTTYTPEGELLLTSAPEDTITIGDRLHRPYPPGNVKINGLYTPATVHYESLTLTFATRNRLQQTVSLTDWYAGNITQEPDVSTKGVLKKVSDNATLSTFTTTGSSASFTTAYIGDVYAEVYTENLGLLKSYQSWLLYFATVNNNAYSRWKINITDVATPGSAFGVTNIAEIQYFDQNMALVLGGTMSGGYMSANYESSARDASTSSFWANYYPCDLIITFDSPQEIKKWGMYPLSTLGGYAYEFARTPKNLTLHASNDGITWVLKSTITNLTWQMFTEDGTSTGTRVFRNFLTNINYDNSYHE